MLRIYVNYTASFGNSNVTGQGAYQGSETGTNKSAFREGQQAALAYPGGLVSYGKQ